MKGKYHLIVQNGNMKYEFDIKRNITILKGDSATGKTALVEMIQEYVNNGVDSGVSLSCTVPCRVLTGNLWKEQLSNTVNSIVFIDEGNHFVKTEEFAKAVLNSDNYYVIITRESLEMLPISVTEIYGIKSSGRYGGLAPVYHEFYHIYDLGKQEEYPLMPEAVIVEDSNSGFDFFRTVVRDGACVSARGKGNIYNLLCERKEDSDTLIVADGAAFGSQMNKIERMVRKNDKLHLYLPESFEWLLLQSGIFKEKGINAVLNNTEDFVESSKYASWERFFTEYLIEISRNSYLQYTKKTLNDNYLKGTIKEQILKSMKGIIFNR